MKQVEAVSNNQNEICSEVQSNSISVKQLPWTEEEDNLIFKFIEGLSQNQKQRVPWVQVTDLINQTIYKGKEIRNNHNVRERWINFLNPQLKKSDWTFEEDCIIVKNRVVKGKNWNVSANKIKDRNSHQIKNRFYQIFSNTLKNQKNSLQVFKQVLSIQNLEEFVEHFRNSKDKKVLKQIKQFQDKKQKVLQLKNAITQEENIQLSPESEKLASILITSNEKQDQLQSIEPKIQPSQMQISVPQPQYIQQPQSQIQTQAFSTQQINPNQQGLQYNIQTNYPPY